MKNIIVWGLGREYAHYEKIINSEEILGKKAAKSGLGGARRVSDCWILR